MRPSVSLGSRQPWITSGHLASQRSTSLSNSNAAQLLRCPSVHRTTGTGQSYLTPKYFSSAKETPYQLRPPILPTLPHSPSAPAWWRACTTEWWLQICVHIVDERGLIVVCTQNPKVTVLLLTTVDFLCVFLKSQSAMRRYICSFLCCPPKEEPRAEPTAIFSWKTWALDS